MASFPCLFLDRPTVSWQVPGEEMVVRTESESSGAARMRELIGTRPIVVADFPAAALDSASIAECGAVMAGRVDAVLAGDSGAARVQFSPTYRAHLIRSTGLEVWSGLNNRDRNRVALEGELAGLRDVGVAGVHCVTGDHTLTGSRPDAAPVFDLDSTATAFLSRSAGHLVSVGESPLAPPTDRRPARLLEKQRAGAEICFVNHAGGVEPVREFIRSAHALGVTMSFIPCVPIIIDRASAELLLAFTSLVLPPGYLDRVLAADDPFRAGVAAAVDLGRAFHSVDGVVGVNLSGGSAPGGEVAFADALALISEELTA